MQGRLSRIIVLYREKIRSEQMRWDLVQTTVLGGLMQGSLSCIIVLDCEEFDGEGFAVNLNKFSRPYEPVNTLLKISRVDRRFHNCMKLTF